MRSHCHGYLSASHLIDSEFTSLSFLQSPSMASQKIQSLLMFRIYAVASKTWRFNPRFYFVISYRCHCWSFHQERPALATLPFWLKCNCLDYFVLVQCIVAMMFLVCIFSAVLIVHSHLRTESVGGRTELERNGKNRDTYAKYSGSYDKAVDHPNKSRNSDVEGRGRENATSLAREAVLKTREFADWVAY